MKFPWELVTISDLDEYIRNIGGYTHYDMNDAYTIAQTILNTTGKLNDELYALYESYNIAEIEEPVSDPTLLTKYLNLINGVMLQYLMIKTYDLDLNQVKVLFNLYSVQVLKTKFYLLKYTLNKYGEELYERVKYMSSDEIYDEIIAIQSQPKLITEDKIMNVINEDGIDRDIAIKIQDIISNSSFDINRVHDTYGPALKASSMGKHKLVEWLMINHLYNPKYIVDILSNLDDGTDEGVNVLSSIFKRITLNIDNRYALGMKISEETRKYLNIR